MVLAATIRTPENGIYLVLAKAKKRVFTGSYRADNRTRRAARSDSIADRLDSQLEQTNHPQVAMFEDTFPKLVDKLGNFLSHLLRKEKSQEAVATDKNEAEPLSVDNAIVEKVVDDFLFIECGVHYRGKTNGYWREETKILAILDRDQQRVEVNWQSEWTEIAPGIELRTADKVWKTGRQEFAEKQALRIHRSACPVYVRFLSTSRLTFYDDSEYDSFHSVETWHRYESGDAESGLAEPSA